MRLSRSSASLPWRSQDNKKLKSQGKQFGLEDAKSVTHGNRRRHLINTGSALAKHVAGKGD